MLGVLQPKVDEGALARLLDMGWSQAQAERALSMFDNSVERAADWLLDQPANTPAPFQPPSSTPLQHPSAANAAPTDTKTALQDADADIPLVWSAQVPQGGLGRSSDVHGAVRQPQYLPPSLPQGRASQPGMPMGMPSAEQNASLQIRGAEDGMPSGGGAVGAKPSGVWTDRD